MEVLENASATLEELDARLRSGSWSNAAAQTRQQLGDWVVNVQPRLEEAVEAARRADAQPVLARLSRAQQRLGQAIARRLAKTEAGREVALEGQLRAWLRLAEHTGLPSRPAKPLAEASVTVRPLGWLGVLALAGVMLVIDQPHEAGVLVVLAGTTWSWIKQGFRYRLYADALIVEAEDEAPVEVPLRSMARAEAAPGSTLRGLVDVELPRGEGFEFFCAQLNTLFSDREQLEQQQRGLARFAGAAGLWLGASWQRKEVPTPEAVEVFKFVKLTGAAPLEKRVVAARASPAVPGAALVCERGVLFVAQAAEPAVRKLLFDTGGIELLGDEQRPLSSFPAALVLERLEALARLPDVHWLDITGPAEWTSEGDDEAVTLPEGRLTVRVDSPSRVVLRGLWPRRVDRPSAAEGS